MKKNLLFVALFSSLFLIGCIIEPVPESPLCTNDFDADFKAYNIFKKDTSWWVYTSPVGQRDSVYIVAQYDKGATIVMSTYFNREITFENSPPCDGFDFSYSRYGPVNAFGLITTFFSNKPEGTSIGFPIGDTVKYLKYYTSFIINGRTYADVRAFENKNKVLNGTEPKITYYARGVGIIRKEFFNGQIWELEKYSVKQ